MKKTVGELACTLAGRAPFDFAEDWDNVGLLAGDSDEELRGIVVAVNLGPEALAAAAKARANVVVCHHPPIFKPVSKITKASSPFLHEAIRSGLNVIALHTNFDLASEKLSRELAKRLGFEFDGFLAGRGGGTPGSVRQGKFITYVPKDALSKVREAVCAIGAGRIGDYTQCSFSWEGEGTFLGGAGSSPTIGKAGRLENARERRLEVVFPWNKLDGVIAAARAAHPYEEMAFDILELAQPSQTIGYGFVGSASEAAGLGRSAAFAFHKVLDSVKQTFQLQTVTVAGPGLSNSGMKVRKIAFSPGSGSAFVSDASARGADVYVCGEVGYHQMLEARQRGLTLVMLGHSYSEKFFVETAADWCEPFGSVKKVFETVHDTV
jgi:dinuclear metal center YbgI/SA1388 family protein